MSTDPDRDPALAALWREHSTETPPPQVDAAILAAAHREAASGSYGRKRWPGPRAWRWWVPLAAAAVVAMVVVGVKPPSQTLVDDAVQSASDMPATPAEKPNATPTPVAPPVVTSPRTEAAPSGIAPPPQIAPVAPDASAPRERGKLDAERVQTFTAPPPARAAESIAAPAQPASPAGAVARGSSAAAAKSTAPAAREDRAITLSAEDWIARIRALRERGAQDEASRELARFRTAYPDADIRLPADLREWAKTVR